jgi:hypothetical protein
MQDGTKNAPAIEAGADEATLWNELDTAERDLESASPPEGRERDDGFANEQDTQAQAGEAGGTSQDDPPQQETPAQAGDDATAKNDPWASAPAELRAAFEEERRARTNLEHRLKSDEGRVPFLNRRLAELEKQLQAVQNPRKAGTAEEREAQRKQLAEEYPELASPLLSELDELREEMTAIRAERQREEANKYATNEQQLTQKHADWRDVLGKNGSTFEAWLHDQPRVVRETIAQNAHQIVDPDGAADVISRFKQHLGIAVQQQPANQATPRPSLNDKRQRQLAGSAAPRGNTGRPVASGIPEDGDPEAIWAAFDEQERRQSR